MKAYLIVNEFLNTDKFNEIHDYLLKAFSKKGIEIKIKTNSEITIDLESDAYHQSYGGQATIGKDIDFVLFWDKDINLGTHLENLGYRLFNSADSIRISDDKCLTHLKLMNAGIPMPRTIIAPMTYENIGYSNIKFLDNIIDRLGFPMIIKEAFGSFGKQVYLANNQEDLLKILDKTKSKPILFQEYIKTSHGRDIRLQVVGNKVVASMYRYSEDGDFRANITAGGKMKPYTPTEEEERLAIEAVKIMGLDFGGVDLLFGHDEKSIVCEVNSNAHFVNIYECTGVNAAEIIADYCYNQVIENGKKQESK